MEEILLKQQELLDAIRAEKNRVVRCQNYQAAAVLREFERTLENDVERIQNFYATLD
jgi:hypothetical protein